MFDLINWSFWMQQTTEFLSIDPKIHFYQSNKNYCNENIFIFPWLKPKSALRLQTDFSQKLSICSKLCFAIGGAPKEVAASATAFFLQIYLLDVAQVGSSRTHRTVKKDHFMTLHSEFFCRSTPSRPPWCCSSVKSGGRWPTPLLGSLSRRADGRRSADSCHGKPRIIPETAVYFMHNLIGLC